MRVLTTGLLVALCSTACEGQSDGTPVAAEALCERVAFVICDADEACFPEHATGDCVEVQTEACEASLLPLATDPRLRYDARRAGAFVAALEDDGEACWARHRAYDGLLNAFLGTGLPGADCTPEDDGTPALLVSSLSCSGGAACRVHLRADGTTEGVCEARVDGTCSHPLDCRSGQYCSLPASWHPGVWGECRPLRADGWACGSDLECASRFCDGTCRDPGALEVPLTVGYDAFVVEDEPLAYFRFDGARGAFASEVGRLSASPSGPIGHAEGGLFEDDDTGSVELNGTDGHLTVGAVGALADAEAFALEVWFSRAAGDGIQPILELVDGESVGTHLWNYDRGDKLYANVVALDEMDAPTSHSIMSAEGMVSSDAWHHAVLSYDGELARLYLDGAEIGTTALTGPLGLGSVLEVGYRAGRGEETARFFAGRLDELAIYEHALTPEQIRLHATVGREGARRNPFRLFSWVSR